MSERRARCAYFATLSLFLGAAAAHAQEARPGSLTPPDLGLSGNFRWQTVYVDGKFTRSVFQEAAMTPKDVQNKSLWTSIAYPREDVSTIRYSYLFGKISDAAKPAAGDSFFQASGVFDSAARMPQHVSLKAGLGQPDGKVVAELKTVDLVFLTEYSWRESVTKIATSQSEAIVLIVIDLAVFSLQEKLGKDHDVAKVSKWLREHGQKELGPVLLGLVEHTADTANATTQQEAEAALVKKLQKDHNLDAKDRLIDQLATLVSRQVVDKQGKPASRERVTEWLDTFPLILVLAAATPGPRFESSIDLPGLVLETNGSPPPPPKGGMVGVGGSSRLNIVRESKDEPRTSGRAEMRWQFTRTSALTGDFTMRLTTLASEQALQKKLLGRIPLDSKEPALAYRKLAMDNEPLLKVLKACREKGNLQPLTQYRAGLAATQVRERKDVEQLQKLLGVP